eukprot:1934431-Amphidinium_carterae.1
MSLWIRYPSFQLLAASVYTLHDLSAWWFGGSATDFCDTKDRFVVVSPCSGLNELVCGCWHCQASGLSLII